MAVVTAFGVSRRLKPKAQAALKAALAEQASQSQGHPDCRLRLRKEPGPPPMVVIVARRRNAA